MAFWAPLIGAGISALGSLFGSKKEQKTETTVDYVKMAANAEKAGFNPLTAIRNGGSAGFTTTTHPALSMADRFGQAFQTLGNALMSFDPRADERAELEERMMRAQLARIQGPTDGFRAMMFGDVPQAAKSSVVGGGGQSLRAMPPTSSSWFDPPKLVAGTTAVSGFGNRPGSGGALPLWVPTIDRDGQVLWTANPDGPDLEQIAGAYMTRSINGWERFVGAGVEAVSSGKGVKVKKMPLPHPGQTGSSADSWWPSFSINWR